MKIIFIIISYCTHKQWCAAYSLRRIVLAKVRVCDKRRGLQLVALFETIVLRV